MNITPDHRTTEAGNFPMDDLDPEVLKKKVTFAYCSRGNDVFPGLVTYLLQQHHVFESMSLVSATQDYRPSTDFLFELVNKTNYEFVHLLEPNVAPRKDTTVRLMTHDVDIVSCPVWFYDDGTNSIHLNYHTDEECLREYTPKDPSAGLERIFASSFGCVVIKKRVIDTFFQTSEKFGTWSNLIDEKFQEASPDTIFFAKAKAFGFDAYLDWSCEFATHHKHLSLNARTVETFVAHRPFARELGVEEKRAKLGTKEGRAELADRLQRGPDVEHSGQAPAASTEGESSKAGETHEISAA